MQQNREQDLSEIPFEFLVSKQAQEFAAREPASADKKQIEVAYFPIVGKDEFGEDIWGPRTVEVFSDLKTLQSSNMLGVFIQAIRDDRLFSVDYWVTAFADEPNAHFTRPPPGTLGEVAGRFNKAHPLPLLSEHSWFSESHRGMVLEMQADPNSKPNPTLDAKVSIRDNATANKFFSGMVQSYSIGLSSEDYSCSVCNQKYVVQESWFGKFRAPSCEHKVGVKYGGKVCEAYMHGATPVELSMAKRPAVKSARNKGESYSEPDPAPITTSLTDEVQMKTQEQLQAELDAKIAEFSELQAKNQEYVAKVTGLEKELSENKKLLDAEKARSAELFTVGKEFSIALLLEKRLISPAMAKSESFNANYADLPLRRAHDVYSGEKPRVHESKQIITQPVGDPIPTQKPYVFGQSLDTLQKEGAIK